MKNKIFNENNIDTMIRISDGSISGIITSPPYNITSKRNDVYYNNGYSNIDGLSEDDYLRVFIIIISRFKYFVFF